MRKIIIVILAALLAGNIEPVYGAETAEKQSLPELSAQTAIMIEANSGEELYRKNPDQKAYPASITKIMTAETGLRSDIPKQPAERLWRPRNETAWS
jgi:D-alanyl-D-alanine carboxypeptidase